MHKSDFKHDNISLQDKLYSIFALRKNKSQINWDNKEYLKLLKKFNNPHHNLPPIIHVAGTNGKGSIIAMLRAILEAQGLTVHCYTSPHLIQVNERIYLAGSDITDNHLEQLIDQALNYATNTPLSFFEILTAIAFKAFADTPADILLLEVGMGGRLDCTNVINNPIATIINQISMDHTEFLGDTIAQIAAEKAGIIKENVPCIIGKQAYKTVTDILENTAHETNAPIINWNIAQQNNHIIFNYNNSTHNFPLPALSGNHQIQNAGAAIASLFSIKDKIKVSNQAIITGLKSVQWRGRMQKLNPSDFNTSDNTEIWLDCGHNDSAGEALSEIISAQNKDVHLIVGMLQSKDHQEFLRPLLPHISSLNIVPISSEEKSLDKNQININNVIKHDNFQSALEHISSNNENTVILIAGSVYLAGEVLSSI